MGWSEKAKASGGTVEGEITDYTFMDTFPFGDGEQEDNESIFLLLEVTPEGADEPVKRSLYLGSSKFLTIEEDGKVLVSTDEDGTPKLFGDGEVCKFIDSLEAADFPANDLFPDPNESKTIDFRGMLGWRIRLVNETDEEATKKFGKRKVTKGKHKGKEFNRTYNKVTKVFAPEGGKKNSGAKAKADVKAKGKAKPVEDDDADEAPAISDKAADKFLLGLLKAQPKGTVEKGGLALAITRYARDTKMDNDARDEMRGFLVADDFAALDAAVKRETIEINKKGVISAA